MTTINEGVEKMGCFRRLLSVVTAWRSIKLHVLSRLLIAMALSTTAVQGRAAVIGSVTGCIDNPDYTFCNANFSASVSGSSWSFDVLFGDGAYIEVLVGGRVEIDIFPRIDGVSTETTISGFTVSLLGEDGSPLSTPSFPSLALDLLFGSDLSIESTNDIAVGTKIRGFHAQMNCSTSNLPEGVIDPCATGHTFSTLAVTVDGASRDDVTLRVGRLPPVTAVPEPAGAGLMLVALALAAGAGIRRTKKA